MIYVMYLEDFDSFCCFENEKIWIRIALHTNDKFPYQVLVLAEV